MMLSPPANITIASVIIAIIGRRRGVKLNIISWEGHHTNANYAAAAVVVVEEAAVET